MVAKRISRTTNSSGPWAPTNQFLVKLFNRLLQDAKEFDFVKARLGVGSGENQSEARVDVKAIKEEMGFDEAELSRWSTGKERSDRNPDHAETNNRLIAFFSGSNEKSLSTERQLFHTDLLDRWRKEDERSISTLLELLKQHGAFLRQEKERQRLAELRGLVEEARRAASQAREKRNWSIDLWSPGHTVETIHNSLGRTVNPETAAALDSLSHEAIAAIGRGDFIGQLEVADRVIQLGESMPGTPVLGEGVYLKAEAIRLQADFDGDYGQQEIKRREAIELFGIAVDELRGDPRAVRGLARTEESLGALDKGYYGFDGAYLKLRLRRHEEPRVAHRIFRFEYIRTLRHKVYNLATLQISSVGTGLSRQVREAELLHLVRLSEAEHHAELNSVANIDKNWLGIERFASGVMHAKAWLALGETRIAAGRMCDALKARLDMMAPEGTLTTVEAGNLYWWMTSARAAEAGFPAVQRDSLEDFQMLIEKCKDRALIHQAAEEFLVGSNFD